MRWIHPLSADLREPADVLGGKAHGLVALLRLGLPVPPGFVIGTAACRAFLRDGRFPDGLSEELAAAVAGLEAVTGRCFGGHRRPLLVSVRSGAAVPMPGMMATVLDVGLTGDAAEGLAAESGEDRFVLDSRLRLLTGLTAAATGRPGDFAGSDGSVEARLATAAEAVRRHFGEPVVEDAREQLAQAVAAVFRSWDSPRARTYRALNGVPDGLGTAVTVQAMVFGNRGRRSGTGVAFSRDPATGEPVPHGDLLFGRQGEDVVSGGAAVRPIADLAGREPQVLADLLEALDRGERHCRDACYLEFTFEAGRLWLLQMRPGRFAGAAGARVAVDLADRGVIGRDEALRRVAPGQLRDAGSPRIALADDTGLLVRGVGASPGVAGGRVALTADAAVRMAVDGPVVLVRPQTSPLDLHGLAAAAGVLTALGGPASHAAVVARSMGRPAVVGAAGLTVDVPGGCLRVGGRTVPEGAVLTLDGGLGLAVLGSPPVAAAADDPYLRRFLAWADEVSGDASPRPAARRLAAAQAALGGC
ncbi:PEP/pyruvate-binding domain-containing protein [Kitasatospora sp. DSM 101779]|uniref:PEP/pyruvate-binding domain-containing protein n=1 Tax=Kitasatospora sp. DSM 101779 TaxID=2853165 RepID=UPI0021D816C0|nr:PEP/pyruvate-binding domain-containing protein [Kitasatospora sp. DSM 101779]MCU7820580.1 pyruvate, phosphate dikinase [Kitasatospora sp. DSM 101779]